jgi:catechol-2,3-dioxygenase
MPEASLQLEHLNIPARDPEGLAVWYAQTFGLTAKAHVARGPGVLLAFVRGEPVNRSEFHIGLRVPNRSEFHIGLRVPSRAVLKEWAAKFGTEITPGGEFDTTRTLDPDGNCIEIYCKSEAK